MTRRLKITMIISAILAVAGPALGMLGSVIGMMRSFNNLGASGVSDPRALSNNIGRVLISTTGGLFIGLVSIVVLITCAIIYFVNQSRANTAAAAALPPQPLEPVPHLNDRLDRRG